MYEARKLRQPNDHGVVLETQGVDEAQKRSERMVEAFASSRLRVPVWKRSKRHSIGDS